MTSKLTARVVAGLALLFLAPVLHADVVVMKDGRRLEGKVTSETADKVRLSTGAGDVELARADISTIERGKTHAEEYAEREKAAKTAEDFYQLGLWADDHRMKSNAKRCMLHAVELDAQHAGANGWLGRVSYKGTWMTPAERDQRQAADQEAEMLARGLVRFQERWVTPEEKTHLDKGEVLVDNKWISFADSQRQKGLEEFDGKWLPRAEALARGDVVAAEKATNVHFNLLLADEEIIAGPQTVAELQEIADGLKRGRAWFDTQFQAQPGLELFGGRLAELYMFEDDDAYVASTDHFASLTKTVTPAWTDAVKKTFGFLWWDPYPLSSARRWKRDPSDVVGHCYHHWGHLLLNRLGYDGRLLPPWFDEGVASLLEYRTHERNAVFCRGSRKDAPPGPSTGGPSKPPVSGTKLGKVKMPPRTVAPFDPKAMRSGDWQAALKAGLPEVPAFDLLASLQFDELEGADIAASMGIVEWIESFGPGALRKFLDVLRRTAPLPPARVHPSTWEREKVYNEAFKSATGLELKAADQAWRQWISNR